MKRVEVLVKFLVDSSDEVGLAENIVRSELDGNKQIFKKWYNQYDESYGIVQFEVIENGNI